MDIQKQGIIDQVSESLKSGRKLKDILNTLGIKSSTYYRWKNEISKNDFGGHKVRVHPSDRITTRSLTDDDVSLILKTKDDNPQMRHRQIQGFLQNKDQYFS